MSSQERRSGRGVFLAALAGLGLLVASAAAANGASPALFAQAQSKRTPIMNAKSDCGPDNFSRSQCMIRLILDDLKHNYKGASGGGISEIKANSSTSMTVSLPQEERVQKYTYEFEIGADGTPAIKSKTESVKSFGH